MVPRCTLRTPRLAKLPGRLIAARGDNFVRFRTKFVESNVACATDGERLAKYALTEATSKARLTCRASGETFLLPWPNRLGQREVSTGPRSSSSRMSRLSDSICSKYLRRRALESCLRVARNPHAAWS